MHFIIGTAGHVDHGKTTLIRALTGIETDRLREEKERGLSIVPGFAHLGLPGGRVVGIVDVPGHERFLKNMLAGVSGVDVAMLVIAADEGVMPQTVEHLHILELLHIRRAVIALTKCDMVDADWLALAREDVRARLRATFLGEAPLVEVSAKTGAGLETLKQELERACADIDQQPQVDATDSTHPFRMAIDRAFTVSGFGTVVTGSATAGTVRVGESVEVWRQDAERPVTARVRGIEVHGESAGSATRGQRTALNLVGLDLETTARGDTIAAAGTLHSTRVLDGWLEVLPDAPRPLKDDASVRLYLGTAEVTARVLLYDGARLSLGAAGFARLRLEAALAAARGDRFILREVATERIIGGGLILEADARLGRTATRPALPTLKIAVDAGDDTAVAELLLRRRTAGLTPSQLGVELHRLDVAPVLQQLQTRGVLWSGGGSLLHRVNAMQCRHQIVSTLRESHEREPLQAVVPHDVVRAALPAALPPAVFDALLAELTTAGEIAVTSAGVRLSGHQVVLDAEAQRVRRQLEALAYQAAWQPPTLDELVSQSDQPALARKLCFAAIDAGSLVRVGDFVLAAGRVEEGAVLLKQHLAARGVLTVGDARELLRTTRKWVVPLLEFYDRRGLTKRAGEARVLR